MRKETPESILNKTEYGRKMLQYCQKHDILLQLYYSEEDKTWYVDARVNGRNVWLATLHTITGELYLNNYFPMRETEDQST